MIKINEITVKSSIVASHLPGVDFVINPYIGCSHACIYCYARFMKRFSGHHEAWGTFVDVKTNSPDLIPQRTRKYENKSIFLSSVTDPYIPQEKKYGLTRKILTQLLACQPFLNIQTKSSLILRDMDLLTQFNNCHVGITLTTLNDEIRKEVEPYTSSIPKRIAALKKLKENNLTTYIFIGPIFPFLTDWKSIIRQTRSFTDYYIFENLNMQATIAADIYHWINAKHAEYQQQYRLIQKTGNDYWGVVEQEIQEYCKSRNITFKIYFHHKKLTKKKH